MPITTWGRLEPDIESLDVADGLAEGLVNRIADPLWLLGRQLALGELRGEDGGMPVAVDATLVSHPVTALTIGGTTRPTTAGVPWESTVEAEPDQVDLRLRLRGGELFAAILDEAGLVDAVATARVVLAWPPDAPGIDSTTSDAALIAAGRRWPDGAAVAEAYAAGKLATALALRADQLVAGAKAAATWYAWWSARARAGAPSAWQPDRLEHAFAAVAPTAAGTLRLTADRYAGGRLDWDEFRVVAHEPGGAVPAVQHAMSGAPLPLSIPGMPTTRVWELESDDVDIARRSFGPGDLGMALLTEVALAYAGDWFVAPVSLATGALHRLEALQITDTFGVRSVVRAAHDVRPDPAWALWRLTGDDVGWLLIPEVIADTMTGDPIEDVALRRDELANAGWAIERVVPDALGRGQRRATVTPSDEVTTAADWRYAPLPRLPSDRIPLLRQAAAEGARLVRAGVVDATMGLPNVVGRIVTPAFAVHESELRRVGAVVTRRWQVALDANGERHAWCTRARVPAEPAAGVRLAFDDLIAAPTSAAPTDG
ncbi:MAG: hypothetical protein JNK64_21930 [Myxococcales bacterium]|nr:hypothetical protein [Myxococcales bacterium]